MNDLTNKYFVKRGNASYQDITTRFNGVVVLSVTGMMGRGEPVNVYNEQWVNEQEEDVLVTSVDEYDNPKVVFKNTDIKMTFIVSNKYNPDLDSIEERHDEFLDYMMNGALWIKSAYTNKETYCICLSSYEPQTIKLQRKNGVNYILGELTFHQLDLPKLV